MNINFSPRVFAGLAVIFSLLIFLTIWNFLPSQRTPALPASEGDLVKAGKTLVYYFDALASKDYQSALRLHGSGFETLRTWNPHVDPNNYPELMRLGCEENGWRCLRIGEVIDASEISTSTFSFRVRFRQEDGTFFEQGVCCGEESDRPPIKEFRYIIEKAGKDIFYVKTEPVYTP